MNALIDGFILKLKEGCTAAIQNNLRSTFSVIDDRVSETGYMVSLTPQGWNGTIFNFIHDLSETVIIPIAGLIITYVLIYELLTMVMDKNNFHDFDSSLFFRYLGKACIAVVLVSHTSEIVEALFEVGGNIAATATSHISGSTNLNMDYALYNLLWDQIDTMSLAELAFMVIETLIIRFAVLIMGIYIMVLMYGRFMEIYLYMSVAPIPFATLTNKEWGSIGTNYIRCIIALAFQGFLIMACVGIYATLISSLNTAGTSFADLLNEILIYTVLLVTALGKTSSFSKSIFNAH
ncbi:MAG: hypothetical protein IJ716_01480 [Lachnospiraceae bacterium]|nr:hypothetical protein [Lachnospiraceae bacterium]